MRKQEEINVTAGEASSSIIKRRAQARENFVYKVNLFITAFVVVICAVAGLILIQLINQIASLAVLTAVLCIGLAILGLALRRAFVRLSDIDNLLISDLVARERMYFDFYNESPDMLLSVEVKTGLIVQCNRTLLRVTGYSEEEIIGRYVFSLYHPESLPRVREAYQTLLDKGRINEIELVILRKDGTSLDISLNSSAILSEDGTITYSRSSWRDITDRKTAERAVRESTAALIREKSAEESSRLKSEFLAMVSHEIRTPLNGILGMSDLLLRSDLPSRLFEPAQTLKDSAEVLVVLINDILDLSKIESGKLELDSSTFNPRGLIEDLYQEMRWHAQKKGLSLNLQGLESLPSSVTGDQVRVRQVFSNLISNAIKFTHFGTVTVLAKAPVFSGTSITLAFEVIDTGIGIHPDKLSRLFKPFSQADSSTTRTYGGTGLGLSISKQLVEMMGGSIGVVSAEGEGARFSFAIRLGLAKVQERKVPDKKSAAPIRFDGCRVLVVDDVMVNQKVISLYLHELGCEVIHAKNGLEAIQALAADHFEIVLMDCQMPEMDGYTATQKIRSSRDPKIRNIPIVAVTASAFEEDRQKCLAVGMNGYLAKPIKLLDLQNALRPLVEAPRIDWTVYDELKRLDKYSFIRNVNDLLSMFESRAGSRMQTIVQAVQAKDRQNVKKQTHAFKSSVAYLGAVELKEICDSIKEAVDLGDYEMADILTLRLGREYPKVLSFLKRRFQNESDDFHPVQKS